MGQINRGRFVVAIAAATALVLSAPFLGLIRARLRSAFPEQFVWIVGGAIALGVAAAIGVAIRRIRDHRALRYGALAAAIAIAVGYAILNAGDNRDSDIVELFHFLQYGVVTYLFYRACCGIPDLSLVVLPLLAGLIVGTAEEWLQWFLPVRVGEIRDLYLNLTAITCGLLFSLAIDPPRVFSPFLLSGSGMRIARFAVAAILAVAMFVHIIHLGHAVTDDDIGMFESRYSRDELIALQAEKAAAWRRTPPLHLRRVAREDQYMTEGVQHVSWRNRKWEEQDFLAAWNENLILEKYFVPVLDTPSYISARGHRWPDAQRADAEQRAAEARSANPAALYISGAYPYPIFVWPKAFFWAVVAALCAAVLLVASRLDRTSVRGAHGAAV